MPSRGEMVFVEGYGSPIFVGAGYLDDDSDEEGYVALKYRKYETEEYASGTVTIPIEEFEERRIYPEQQPGDEMIEVSMDDVKGELERRYG